MSISVSVDTSKLNELLAAIPGNKDKAVRSTAFYILGEAVKSAPYRTGYLRSTGGVDTGYSNFVNVQFTAEYAAYVELGTYKMAARPFLTPAVARGESKLVEQLKGGLIK
jgi:HK97 gp10 family phage protein